METDALRWFQQVADGMTVTQVSEVESFTQPAVSRALARLEAEVGTPLLRRSGRTLRLTRAGSAFKHHVDAMMHELDDGLAAVNQLVDPETGTVTLAFQPSLGSWLVPELVRGFRAQHSGIRFDLRPKRDELTTSVRMRGDVDFELSTMRPNGEGVQWRPLTGEPLWLAVPKDHALAGRSEVALKEASSESFITIGRLSQLRRLCEELCAEAGFEPAIAFEADDIPTVLGFVGAGLGVSIVPALRGQAREAAAGPVRYLLIMDAGARRQIGMVWSTERRLLPAARLFREHVVAVAGSTSYGPETP